MKTAAVICEYNPFHNGHAYQLQFIKDKLGADFIVAVMSGNFVQRGEPAVFEKFVRARMALMNGADLVIELPPFFACSSAREFATAGVRAAYLSGVADMLCFGLEGGITSDEIHGYVEKCEKTGGERIREFIREGRTYPEAVSLAAGAADSRLWLPNNILAAEYIRAVKAMGALCGKYMETAAVERTGSGYSSDTLDGSGFASASAIRKALAAGGKASFDKIKPYVPGNIYGIYEGIINGGRAAFPDALGPLLSLRLLDDKYGRDGINIEDCMDVSREMAGRLRKNADRPMGFLERAESLKTRQYTYTRVSRALMHIVLGMTGESLERRKKAGYIEYLRILGFSRNAAKKGLLSRLKKNSKVPVVSKPADFKELLKEDIYADQVYYAVYGGASEYQRTPAAVQG